MSDINKSKIIAVSILIVSIIIIPMAALERYIPRPTYDIIYDNPFGQSESIDIAATPYTPDNSFTLFNESVLKADIDWYKREYTDFNYTSLWRLYTVPYKNVSAIILKLSAFLVKGPLNLSLMHSYWHPDNLESIIGQPGEYCEVAMNLAPENYTHEGESRILVRIQYEGTNLNAFQLLDFSILVNLTLDHCPVTIDLQRTTGESMYELPEFRSIYRVNKKPSVKFNELEFMLHQVNETILLPNGIYEMSIDWEYYEYDFGQIIIMNESLFIACQIKSVRLDIEPIQKIPGLWIEVGGGYDGDDLYTEPFLISSMPSFYLPSGRPQQIEIKGGRFRMSHGGIVSFELEVGANQNITLVIDENWIVLGNLAFTPGRLAFLIAVLVIIGTAGIYSRRNFSKSSILIPSILLLVSSIVPTVNFESMRYSHPSTVPPYSAYTESHSIIMGMSSELYGTPGTRTVFASTDSFYVNFISPILILLLITVAAGIILEILKNRVHATFPDFFVAMPILIFTLIQWYFVFVTLNPPYIPHDTRSISLAPILATIALIAWLILYWRQGKSILETIRSAR